MTRKNNSSSNDVSTVIAWLKPTCQLKEQIVFILQTISMSLSSSACHVAFTHLGWLAIRRLTPAAAATAADVVARNSFVAMETGGGCCLLMI